MPRGGAVSKPENARVTNRGRRISSPKKPLDAEEVEQVRALNTGTYEGAAQVDPDKPLTEKQRAFVKFWAEGNTPLMASVKAGYADGGTFGYRMIHMPNIQRAYAAEKAAYERDSAMTRKRVIDGLLEGIEMAKQLGEPASVISGWREVGKMCGYYEPVTIKHKVSVEGKLLTQRLDRMSDAELFELIQQQAQAITHEPSTSDPDQTTAEAGEAE